MKRTILTTSLLISPCALWAIGCGSDSGTVDSSGSEDATEIEESADAKADSPSTSGMVPVGTFRASGVKVGDEGFAVIVLKTDNTFHIERLTGEQIDGKFKFIKKDGVQYLRLLKFADGENANYEYTFDGPKLTLKASSKALRQEYEHSSDGWCGEAADCKSQLLPQPRCMGEWTCEENTCKFSTCGPMPHTDEPAVTCDKIGTRSEGWYDSDGSLICWSNCKGAQAECKAVGSKSEGWYSSIPEAACGRLGGGLIRWEDCAQ